MISAVHHIAFIVSNERCLDFYRLLGFTETFRKVRSYDTAVLMSGYGMELEIFIDNRHPSRFAVEPIGLRHFALKVSQPLEDEIERLRAAGGGAGGRLYYDGEASGLFLGKILMGLGLSCLSNPAAALDFASTLSDYSDCGRGGEGEY